MAHPQQDQFVKETLDMYLEYKTGSVLEIGSLDVNGSIRQHFNSSDYIGVDIVAGKGVDIVCKGHLYSGERSQVLNDEDVPFDGEQFDCVCSAECFEHDEYYPLTLKNMYTHLRKNGLFFFTCASTGRHEHGTRRTTGPDNLWGTAPDYYKNLTEEDIRIAFREMIGLEIEELFLDPEFFYNPVTKDLYFRGLKE